MGKRDFEYEEWIRWQPCVSCGANPPCHCHHSRKLCSGEPIIGAKVSSYCCVSLCGACHTNEHTGYPMDDMELLQKAFALLREFIESKLFE